MSGLRKVAAPFVVLGPSGIAIRDSLKCLTMQAKFITWTGGMLVVVAAGVLAYGFHDLQRPISCRG